MVWLHPLGRQCNSVPLKLMPEGGQGTLLRIQLPPSPHKTAPESLEEPVGICIFNMHWTWFFHTEDQAPSFCWSCIFSFQPHSFLLGHIQLTQFIVFPAVFLSESFLCVPRIPQVDFFLNIENMGNKHRLLVFLGIFLLLWFSYMLGVA